jgi:hypothetical protein
MVGINWTVLTLLVIGLFALAGLFKGWWKEAITTIFLGILVFFLQVPDVAQIFIDLINLIISTIWRILPDFVLDFLETVLGIGATGAPPQIDAGSAQTWLIVLIVFIGLAILIGRLSLPGSGRRADTYSSYVVTFGGSLFGALLGALNGWLIIGLIRTYLDGRSLPGGGEMAATSMATPPSDQVVIQAVDVPHTTILDSFLPWLFVGIGLVVLLAAIRSRVTVKEKKGFRKVVYKSPVGYEKAKTTFSGFD